MKNGILREISFPIIELNVILRSHILYSRSLIENKVIPFVHGMFDELNPYFEGTSYFYINYPNVVFLIDKVYITHTKDDDRATV